MHNGRRRRAPFELTSAETGQLYQDATITSTQPMLGSKLAALLEEVQPAAKARGYGELAVLFVGPGRRSREVRSRRVRAFAPPEPGEWALRSGVPVPKRPFTRSLLPA